MTESLDKIKKQIRLLSVYAMISSFLLLIAMFQIFKMDRKTKNLTVEELTANRINIVEPNGQPRLVLSNVEKSPANLNHGKPFGIPGTEPKQPGWHYNTDSKPSISTVFLFKFSRPILGQFTFTKK